MAPWRYRKCPSCGTVRPGGEFEPVKRQARWAGHGWNWRVCPSCGHRGRTKDFTVVADLREQKHEGSPSL